MFLAWSLVVAIMYKNNLSICLTYQFVEHY